MTELIKPGITIRRFYYEGNPNNCLMHIRAIVDEEWVVYRVWSKVKRDWRYHVEYIGYFDVAKEHLTKV